MADDGAGGVARDGSLGLGGLQDFGGVIVEDGTKEIGEGGAVFGVVAEELGGALGPGDLFGGEIGGQPAVFAEDGDYVGSGVRIFLDGMFGYVVLGGHGEVGGGSGSDKGRGGQGERGRYKERVATACAAMASPRPTASTPSLVLAFRWIFSVGTRRAFARASRIFGKWGPSFGRSRMTTASTCSMARCFSSRSLRACSRNRRLFAPFHLGSVSGKCVPMSPRPAAPSSASQSAWATTSPSECPTGPLSKGTSMPPMMSLRPSARRCRS